MKRLVTVWMLVLLSLVPAFGSESAGERLRIGVDPTYPPFSDIDDAGRLVGFDIDIALAMCAWLEVECVFVRKEWEKLIPALRSGEFDAIVSSMSITRKRQQLVAFTERYYSNEVRFVARKGMDFAPADLPSRTVGVISSTVASDWLEENRFKFAGIRGYTNQKKLVQALIEGRVDAMFGDALGYWDWLRSAEGAGFAFAGEAYRLDEGIGIAVRKESDDLRQRLNGALRAILSDGAYEKINARYFPFSIY